MHTRAERLNPRRQTLQRILACGTDRLCDTVPDPVSDLDSVAEHVWRQLKREPLWLALLSPRRHSPVTRFGPTCPWPRWIAQSRHPLACKNCCNLVLASAREMAGDGPKRPMNGARWTAYILRREGRSNPESSAMAPMSAWNVLPRY